MTIQIMVPNQPDIPTLASSLYFFYFAHFCHANKYSLLSGLSRQSSFLIQSRCENPPDLNPVDLLGALPILKHHGVAGVLLHRQFSHHAAATENLQRSETDLKGSLCTKDLGRVHKSRIHLVHIPRPGKAPQKRSSGLEDLVHLGYVHCDSLVVNNRSAALNALIGVLHGRIQGSSSEGHGVGSKFDFAGNSFGPGPALLSPQQVFHWHLDVVEVKFTLDIYAEADLIVDGCDLKARSIRRQNEAAAPFVTAKGLIRPRRDDQHLGHRTVGDKVLAAVENVVVPLALGGEHHSCFRRLVRKLVV